MVELKAQLLIFVGLLLYFQVYSGYLDIEELSSVNYGIDIIDKPVVIGEEPPGAIVLRSKYGQQYQCSYTDWEREDEKERLEQQEAIDIGIPELLRPLADAGCLIYPKDWWTYEFCFGKHLKQYHVEDNKITGSVIYLGYYESEFDWSNITDKDKKRKYHSQMYTNGTTCDLTNKPRQVEVRFECEEGATDVISEISEAPTCVYTLIVRTARICKHPYLKKEATARPVPITCNPLISAEQYQEYLNLEQEQEGGSTKKYKLVENNADTGKATYLSESNPVSMKPDESVIDQSESPNDVNEAPGRPQQGAEEDIVKEKENQKSNNRVLTEKLINEILRAAGVKSETKDSTQKDPTGKSSEDMGSQELESHQDQNIDVNEAQENVEENLGPAGKETRDKRGDTEEDGDVKDSVPDVIQNAAAAEADISVQQDNVGDDEKIMAEIDKELSEILDTAEKKAHMAMHEANIESAMQAKFSDIVEEAERELAQEGDPVQADRQQAFRDLARTLTKLMSRLRHTEREKRVTEKNLRRAQLLAAGAKARKQSREPLDFTKASDLDKPAEERKDRTTETEGEFQEDAAKQPVKDHSLSGTKTNIEDGDSNSDIEDGNSLTQEQSLNNRVRVRVTRIKHAAPAEKTDQDGTISEEDDGKQTLQIADDQRKELESTVKSELEKAGLETKGQKIEVRIITAGYFDTNKEGMHVLSAEESSAFNNMIIAILGGNSQAAKEMTRQQQMEDAYKHVWSKDKKQKTSTTDPPAPPS